MPAKAKKKTTRKHPTREQARAIGVPKRDFPAHLDSTPEEWRARKRTEWREVTQALDRYNLGSAFAPAGPALYRLRTLASQITEAIEAPDWIAW